MIDWTRLCALRDSHETRLASYVEERLDQLEEGLMRLPYTPPVVITGLLYRLGMAATDLGMHGLGGQMLASAANPTDVDMTALITTYATSKQMLMRDLNRLIDGGSDQDVA